MKKQMLPILLMPLLLTSCSFTNTLSFTFVSYSATYESGVTEATFFEGFTNQFKNMEDFANKASTYYCSTKKGAQ